MALKAKDRLQRKSSLGRSRLNQIPLRVLKVPTPVTSRTSVRRRGTRSEAAPQKHPHLQAEIGSWRGNAGRAPGARPLAPAGKGWEVWELSGRAGTPRRQPGSRRQAAGLLYGGGGRSIGARSRMHPLTSVHPPSGRDLPPLGRLLRGPQHSPPGAPGPAVTHPAPPPATGAEYTARTAAPGHPAHRPWSPWPRRTPDPQDRPFGPALRRRCPLGAASFAARRGAGTRHRSLWTARARERACPPRPAPSLG